MNKAETALAMAERHVREIEEIVARQTDRVEKLEAFGDHERTKQAGKLLATFIVNLELARDRLRLERSAHDTKP